MHWGPRAARWLSVERARDLPGVQGATAPGAEAPGPHCGAGAAPASAVVTAEAQAAAWPASRGRAPRLLPGRRRGGRSWAGGPGAHQWVPSCPPLWPSACDSGIPRVRSTGTRQGEVVAVREPMWKLPARHVLSCGQQGRRGRRAAALSCRPCPPPSAPARRGDGPCTGGLGGLPAASQITPRRRPAPAPTQAPSASARGAETASFCTCSVAFLSSFLQTRCCLTRGSTGDPRGGAGGAEGSGPCSGHCGLAA